MGFLNEPAILKGSIENLIWGFIIRHSSRSITKQTLFYENKLHSINGFFISHENQPARSVLTP